jgi:putative phosphoesterase
MGPGVGRPVVLGSGRKTMRIGILSDTHDQVARTARAVELLVAAGAEALVHCGDLTGPDVVDTCAGLPSYFVFGNCDYDERALRRAMTVAGGFCLGRGGELVLGGRRIAVTHGHSAADVRHLAAAAPDYLLFGHSHVVADRREGPTRWINPGALHRAPVWTVALLDLATDRLTTLTVCDTC